jgi:hypothetical protein
MVGRPTDFQRGDYRGGTARLVACLSGTGYVKLLDIIAVMFSSLAANEGIDRLRLALRQSATAAVRWGTSRFAELRADHVPERRQIDFRLSTAARPACQSFPQKLQLVKQSTLNSRHPESHIQHGVPALNARMFHAAARPLRLVTL